MQSSSLRSAGFQPALRAADFQSAIYLQARCPRSHHVYKMLIIFAGFLLSCAFTVDALEIPPPSGNYVNDYASLLSPEARERLEQRLRKLGAETSTQIIVATFPSLEDESLEDFTNRMYEAWRIGQKDNDNGVLLAIFVNERKVRIEVGYGLEGALPDALSGRIIRDEFVPQFRAGNPEQGIENTVIAIEKAVRGEYTTRRRKSRKIPNRSVDFADVVSFVFYVSFEQTRGIYDRTNAQRQG